jgi:hypothetical protein
MRRASEKSALLSCAMCFVFLLALLSTSLSAPAQEIPYSQNKSSAHGVETEKLTVIVSDENGVGVRGARVQLTNPQMENPQRCETDFSGRCELTGISAGAHEVRIEKVGFYAAILPTVEVGEVSEVEVSLAAVHELHEVITVTESPPAIDQAQISAKEELTGSEIIDIPYPGPHDYRNALTYIPGVNPDGFGSPHIVGAESFQTLTLLDGFNVTQPGTGNLEVRTAVDSFRSITVVPSREPAEFGKGSGGVLNLNTGMGNDHFRLISTDFIPSVQDTKGEIALASWTPIYTLSGPLVKRKAWFIDSLDGEYDNNKIVANPTPSTEELYTDQVWRIDNLAKVQANVTPRNIMAVSFLSNWSRDPHSGVSAEAPPATTPVDAEFAEIASVKDQYSLKSGALLEVGFGVDQYNASLLPAGIEPYAIWMDEASGNYYLNEHTIASRWQGLSNLYFAPRHWHGRHDIKIGTDLDRVDFEGRFTRQPISFLISAPPENQPPQACATDAEGVPIQPYTCSRYSEFSGGGYAATHNAETSAYVEDRWLVTNRLLVEPGLRFDWDEIVRTPLFSPRLGGTYMLDDEGNTKLSAGMGIIYDATFLGWIAEPLEGQRTDYFFKCQQTPLGVCSSVVPTDASGNPTPQPEPVQTSFSVNRNGLQAPRYLNWSAGIEKKLPGAIFVKTEFIEKRGVDGFVYNSLTGAESGDFVLQNTRDDHYYAFTVSARHTFGKHYEIFGAYTRSHSYSNQVLDYGLDLLVFSPQLPGPYLWDIPNRFVGYGILPAKLPVVHVFDVVYSVEARNGLPFNVANDQFQAIAADPPGTFRLPTYFSLNLQFEKKVHLFRRYWAVRGGFNNITNHGNAAVANGILDASHPLPTYTDQAGRALAVRIRLVGKG